MILRCDASHHRADPNEELEEFFILSDLKIEAGEETERLHFEDTASKMRPLLAAPAECREERRASGFVRSLRGCCRRVARMNVEPR